MICDTLGMLLDRVRTARELLPKIDRAFTASAAKICGLERTWRAEDGAPVFTAEGRYRSRGWTEWTQGFQFGSALLQFDATGDPEFLELGRARTVERMAPHISHVGVHDHGFNNVSTYGTLWRLAREGRIEASDWEVHFYELALKISGAVQARRWTPLPDGGFIHSFNGAHSLFADTMRSLRSLALSYLFGHYLADEQDTHVSLLQRLVHHARATAQFNVYYGQGRDSFDVRGRVAHESLFNTANGTYRGPNSQQGYSPFSTWTRGLSWVMLGFAEQVEFLDTLNDPSTSLNSTSLSSTSLRASRAGRAGRASAALGPIGDREAIDRCFMEAARATSDFYIEHAAAADGVPYWDTGAPGLSALGDWQQRPADPFNDHEPVDSSAAAIAAQALLRLGHVLQARGEDGTRYEQAGLRVVDTLLSEPYLSTSPNHQGLLLHAVYHVPNGWDHVPPGARTPRGEATAWGDYHLREVALYVKRLAEGGPYLTFFGNRNAEWPA